MSVKDLKTTVAEELATLFKKVSRKNKSSKFLAIDLHVHSPASKCYRRSSEDIDEDYKLLIKKIASSDISIIAITDHNTAAGFFRIKQILEIDSELSSLMSEKLVLPGIEITCYSKHFLVLFPETVKEDLINAFLIDCGITIDEQGKEVASADKVSPLLLCEKVEQYGGITILAHCDAEHGLLQSYISKSTDIAKEKSEDIRGSSIKKILQSPSVHGVCYNSPSNLVRVKELVRGHGGERLALLQASDSHSHLDDYPGPGLPLGSRCSWAKLGQKSFNALRLALKNSNYSVINEPPVDKKNPYIVGLCIYGGFIKDKHNLGWACIPYSSELNCIIGARGTGKSTIMSILKFLLDKNNIELRDEVVKRSDSFDTAVVFLQDDDQLFAIRMAPQSVSRLNISYWKLKKDGFNFTLSNSQSMKTELQSLTKGMETSKFITSTNIQSYGQKEIFNLANLPEGPSNLLDTLCALQYKSEFKNYLTTIVNLQKPIIEECIKINKKRETNDGGINWDSKYLEEAFKEYREANHNLLLLKSKTVEHLNQLMKDKLRLRYTPYFVSQDELNQLITSWVMKERYSRNTPYERQLEYRRNLTDIFNRTNTDSSLPYYIYTGKAGQLSKEFHVNISFAEHIVKTFYNKVEPEEVLILPKLAVEFDLNVNYGISSKELFKPRNHLSIGQKAVGILFLILHGATELGENRPLFIDQPEDDLDNSYIYHILVKEFQRIKGKRQLVIATHNPNIPIAGDAENILVLGSDGENGWVDFSGSIEDCNISANVLRILEGDFEAFSRRAEKYGFSLKSY